MCRDFAISISREAPCSPRRVRAEWRYSCRSQPVPGPRAAVCSSSRARGLAAGEADQAGVRAHVARADDLPGPGAAACGEVQVRHLVVLTDPGRRRLRAASPAQEEVEDELLHPLNDSQRSQLARILALLRDDLTGGNEHCGTPTSLDGKTPWSEPVSPRLR
ncbi:hypothetical protein GCM10010341_79580 [Streptomyces noursei]|nr:hypothetical protein GCM10010341_79580 [Streptomyces noursei]